MIRITVVSNTGSQSRVVVEGRITSDSSVELASACLERLAGGDRLTLDLSSVTFADSDGIALLRELVERGCVLAECSELVRVLVRIRSSQSPKSIGSGKVDEGELLAQLSRR